MRVAADRGYRVFLFGGGQGVAERAAQRLVEEFPGIQVVGTDASKVSLDDPPEARAPIAQRIAATKPDLVLVCLGAPKQEIFCDQHFRELAPAVMVCVGAGIDFIAGTARRAPRWISRSGLEWLYRLAQEPRRLAGRYLLRDPQFVAILARQILSDRS
jgi:N-acetylglucosaminyldiphosphoundecaprenol N-acetyl-beta-D-mannosaminyltransferase